MPLRQERGAPRGLERRTKVPQKLYHFQLSSSYPPRWRLQHVSTSRASPGSEFFPCVLPGCPCCHFGGCYSCFESSSPAAAMELDPRAAAKLCLCSVPRLSSPCPAVPYSRRTKDHEPCSHTVPSLCRTALSPSLRPVVTAIPSITQVLPSTAFPWVKGTNSDTEQ